MRYLPVRQGGQVQSGEAAYRRCGIRGDCIGDEARDIEAAREAGVAAGAVAWGYATPALLQSRELDAMFASLQDIANRLTTGRNRKAAC